MTPVTFDGCFGWLHAPQGRRGSDVAVLICTGLLQDAILAYGSLRVLADDLAAAGYATLRFDYPGTGDSCDDAAENDGHWTAWQRSVDQGADWLRATTGANRLVLCGLRLGTTLATLAAARRNDVAGLLLFEPVVSGRNYVRQLLLEAEMLSGDATLTRRRRPLSPRVPLRSRDAGSARRSRPAQTWPETRHPRRPLRSGRKQGSRGRGRSLAQGGRGGRQLGWNGLDPLVRHKVIDEDVLADFTAVLQMDQERVPVHPTATAVVTGRSHPPSARLHRDCLVRFGPDRRLFGMLCRPDDGPLGTVVLLGNAGHDPHYASARHAVTLSRKLAARGIASLRLDYAGLGDSIGPAGKERMLSHVFAVDRGPDVSAAVDALQAMGYRRFGIEGLCSGAFHAFRTALTEPRINTVLVVNLPFFTLPAGSVLGYLEQKDRSARDYLAKLSRPRTWATLASGKVDYPGIFVGPAGPRCAPRAKSPGLARRAEACCASRASPSRR